MKLGVFPRDVSGSFEKSSQHEVDEDYKIVQDDRYHFTWTYSTTLLSPRSRVAETLVAGKAFGTTFRTVRLRELMTDKEEMVTIHTSPSALPTHEFLRT